MQFNRVSEIKLIELMPVFIYSYILVKYSSTSKVSNLRVVLDDFWCFKTSVNSIRRILRIRLLIELSQKSTLISVDCVSKMGWLEKPPFSIQRLRDFYDP